MTNHPNRAVTCVLAETRCVNPVFSKINPNHLSSDEYEVIIASGTRAEMVALAEKLATDRPLITKQALVGGDFARAVKAAIDRGTQPNDLVLTRSVYNEAVAKMNGIASEM